MSNPILVSVRKDSPINADFIKAYAAQHNESTSEFLLRAATAAMLRDKNRVVGKECFTFAVDNADEIRAHVKARGEGVGDFLRRAVADALARESEKSCKQ